jgi:transposase
MLVLDKEPLPELDRQVFEMVVPEDHFLRQVAKQIDFERFRQRLAGAYCLNMGRPAVDPVRMLKILFLRFHYKLSDRQVMNRAVTDLAFRWFLGLPLKKPVPHHTEGTYFRNRIGEERFVQVFQDLVTQAREAGLVQDRLRLKDATHLFADVTRVTPLALAAQVREHLLKAAAPFFAEWVDEQRARLDALRKATAELAHNERLAARIEHLQEMTAQLRERRAALPPAATNDAKRQRLERALAVATKLLEDRADPESKDRLTSAVDPDARVGFHNGFFLGYVLDMAIDADSELITGVNVLPGNGAGMEAADAITLIQQEEAAQGNDVEGLSIDGIGYNGPVLRELTDPEGLNLDVTVPPPQTPVHTTFGAERFTLTVLPDGNAELTCPNGQTTRTHNRTGKDTGTQYTFKKSQCTHCPLREQCLQKPQGTRPRSVIINDYEPEYQRIKAKVQTPEYQQTRRAHRKIERKLGEVVRHHNARRTAYRGLPKVLTQAALTALVVNVKRIVELVAEKTRKAIAALPVRAELAQT